MHLLKRLESIGTPVFKRIATDHSGPGLSPMKSGDWLAITKPKREFGQLSDKLSLNPEKVQNDGTQIVKSASCAW
jgi:hypothetical protein